MLKKREDEINKSILEWLIIHNYTSAIEPFLSETKLQKSDATTGNKLEKKWGTILSLQKKITDLENEVKQLKSDLESGGGANMSKELKQSSDSMGLPRSVQKATIKGHRLAVTCMCFHPFYKRLASGSDDASIIIWECDEFSQDKSLRAHSDTINHLVFDNSGKYLASCSNDTTVKIWNFESMTVYRTLNGHEHTVSSCEFFNEGNFLFSCSRDKNIKLWDIQSGNCLKTLSKHSEWVRSLSVKGNYLASSSDDEKIFIWDTNNIDNINLMYELSGHTNKIEQILFIKNDKAIYNIYASDFLSQGKKSSDEKIEESIPSDIMKSNLDQLAKLNERLVKKQNLLLNKEKINKEYLLSCSRDKTIMLWDVIGGICIFKFIGHDNWVRSICEHPNGKYFISSSDDKSIRIWDFKNGLCAKKLSNSHEKFVTCISMSPKCKLLASGSNDCTIKVWDCS